MTAATPEQERLYAAYSAAYGKEANRRLLVFIIDASFAVLGLALALLDLDWSALGVFGVAWLLVREIPFFVDPHPWRRVAVTIQEQFDLSFYQPDWASALNKLRCGAPLRDHQIRQLAATYQGQAFEPDYWIDTSGLLPNASALLRILQSAAWGSEGHRRYSTLNYAAVVLSALGLLLVALSLDLTIWDAMTKVAVPCTPFLLGRMQAARRHRRLAERRSDLYDHIKESLGQVSDDADPVAVRTAQDELYELRLADSRIPSWLYLRYRAGDKATIDASIDAVVQELRERVGLRRF